MSNKHIEKLIKVAEAEIGYLEKKSNSNLDDKTANAGSNNYTKYWRDVYPAGQAQAWCAIFVNWCFDKAFGKENTKKLLKHYPYTYCPTMGNLFTKHANPEVGDIVIFKSNGSFVHTGLVVEVKGDLFKTIEGNTSGASGIIANGGGVCKKTHYNSNLPGTKFCRPDYNGILGKEENTQEVAEVEKLRKEVESLKAELEAVKSIPIYNYIDDNMPSWARPTVTKLVARGDLKGDEEGRLNLDTNMLRILVINDRAGVYDKE